jgi:hypothetical protein
VQRWSGVVRMGAAVGGGQGGGEEEETRQAKEMAAARRRWETLVSSVSSPLSGFLAKLFPKSHSHLGIAVMFLAYVCCLNSAS